MINRKYIVGAIFSIIMVLLCFNIKSYAHDTNLGIDGAENITYDPCKPYNSVTTDTTDSYGEKWYLLVDSIVYQNQMDHIDDDIKTVYYKINDLGDYENDSHWAYWGEFYCQVIETGMLRWSSTYIYETDENGITHANRLIELINVDDLEDPTSVEVNLTVNVSPDIPSFGCGSCSFIESSEVILDRKTYGNVTHKHFTKYEIWVYPNNCDPSEPHRVDDLLGTGAHEVGHMLGLMDIDYNECSSLYDFHHQELLMGYTDYNIGEDATIDVTYRDVAGAMITRGIHTEEDHRWLYDVSSSTANNHKLICSICNGVRYVSSLDDYDYYIYKSCNNEHDLASGNMMAVARYGERDYWKCRYCRKTTAYYQNEPIQYFYTGECDENTHVVKNNVDGLEYTLVEEHKFKVDLGDGIFKCKYCPMCTDGAIRMPEASVVDFNCEMNEYEETISFEANGYKYFKFDVSCKNDYMISALSLDKVSLEFFDSNMQKINYPVEESIVTINGEPGYKYTISRKFYLGSIYARVSFEDYKKIGTIDFSIESLDDCEEIPIIMHNVYEVKDHVHNNRSEYSFNNTVNRFVKISISTLSPLNNSVNLQYSIFNSDEIIHKYEYNNYSINASTTEDYMIVYLEEDTTYTIVVEGDFDNFESVLLNISWYDNVSYNVFEEEDLDICSNDNANIDKLYSLSFGTIGKYYIDVDYAGSDLTNIIFVLLQEVRSEDDYSYITYEVLLSSMLNATDNSFDASIVLDPSNVYLIGYFTSDNNSGSMNITFGMESTTNIEGFVTDPDGATPCGTEVTLNHGAYRGYNITEGYTRLIYFTSEHPSVSRLDYYWYSSDENILSVSDFGTVLAHNVNNTKTATIMAIYKYDLTKTYKVTFTILQEPTASLIYIYINMDVPLYGRVQITPDNKWPSKILQHYEWTSFNSDIATVDIWGYITGQAVGSAILKGYYNYNERYIVQVNVNVIEP